MGGWATAVSVTNNTDIILIAGPTHLWSGKLESVKSSQVPTEIIPCIKCFTTGLRTNQYGELTPVSMIDRRLGRVQE